MKEREHWKSRSVFIMAAIGSAIGLGNMWRFPYIAAQNGGGAFLIPYFTALLTSGIPIMILEYGLGIRSQASANIALGSIRPAFRFIGWLAITAAFFIDVYYCSVMGWTWNYIFGLGSFEQWSQTIAASKAHFFQDVLKLSSGPWDFGSISVPLLLGLALTWLSIWAIIRKGLGNVGKVLLFTVPFPILLVLVLIIRGFTLPGAVEGLNFYLAPEWSKLAEPQVWLAAYGQIFFSLSVGFSVMIAYASFMPKDTEVPNSAAITSFANAAFSFLAGLAVFSILGYFAVATNSPIKAEAGPGLAFVVYPAALGQLPFWIKGFGFVFFLTLLLLGIDSAFSILESVAAALSDKFDFSRTKSTTITSILGFCLGLPFVSSAGLYWLDIVDHFIMSYMITSVTIIECVIVGYFLGTKKFCEEINQNAEIGVGPVFSFLIKVANPLILGTLLVMSLKKELSQPYEGYPKSAILVIGVGTLVLIFTISLLLSLIKTQNDKQRKLRSTQEMAKEAAQ